MKRCTSAWVVLVCVISGCGQPEVESLRTQLAEANRAKAEATAELSKYQQSVEAERADLAAKSAQLSAEINLLKHDKERLESDRKEREELFDQKKKEWEERIKKEIEQQALQSQQMEALLKDNADRISKADLDDLRKQLEAQYQAAIDDFKLAESNYLEKTKAAAVGSDQPSSNDRNETVKALESMKAEAARADAAAEEVKKLTGERDDLDAKLKEALQQINDLKAEIAKLKQSSDQ